MIRPHNDASTALLADTKCLVGATVAMVVAFIIDKNFVKIYNLSGIWVFGQGNKLTGKMPFPFRRKKETRNLDPTFRNSVFG